MSLPPFVSQSKSLLSGLLLVLGGCASKNPADNESCLTKPLERIEVIYFHGNMRCLTCMAMEKFARETVDSVFTEEVDEGILSFEVLDVAENEMLADSYQTAGSSLYVTTYHDGEETRQNLTQFGFKTVRKHHKVFQDSLENLIRKSLKTIHS